MKTTFSPSFTSPALPLHAIGVDRFRLLWKGWNVKVLSLLLLVMVGGSVVGQVTIVSDGLNSSSSLFTLSGGAYYTTSSASADRPASIPFYVEGSASRGVINNSATLTSATDINTSGYSDVKLTLRLASFSINSTNNGADAGDIVTIEVSPNSGATWYSTLRVLGNSNAYWAYSASGAATTPYDGDVTPVDFSPSAGGSRTTDGYSTVTVSSLPASPNLKIRITMLNNAAAEQWVVDDFKIIGTLNSPCSGTPAPGNTNSSVTTPIIGGTSTTLSLASATTGSGVTYQWQSSVDNSNWINIATAGTSSNYSAAPLSATYYRCAVTCAAATGYSNFKLVDLTYCASTGTSSTYYISNVTTSGGLTNINLSSTGASGGYIDNSSTYSLSQYAGSNINLSIGSIVGSGTGLSVFVDWNKNYVFESNEKVAGTITWTQLNPWTASFTVPSGTAAGNYKMRIVTDFNSMTPNSCNSVISGETEDYTLTVTQAGPTISNSGTLSALTTTYGTASTNTSFSVSGTNMSAGISITPPAGFEVSTSNTFSSNIGSNSSSLVIGVAGTISSTTVYVRLAASTVVGTYSGNIVLSSSGASSVNVVTVSSTVNAVTPTLSAATSATVDGAFNVTFTDDASWRAAITSITVDGTTLTAGYSVTAGQITFTPSASIPTTLLQSSGSKTIVVNATGYSNATITQSIGFGTATKLGITTQPTAPASNGAVLAVQPVVRIQDQYGNTTTSTANVTAAVGSGSWTLGGTNTISAAAGSATFSGLTATSSIAVTGATITFTCGSLTGITSTTFNISAPPLGIPTAGAATNVSCSNFTANWTAVTGASSGYFLDVSTKVNFCNNATDLFISEYVEGTSSNKYIEIFNGTGSDVNLTNYQLQMFANGASTATTSVTLSGTLANGNTIVYKNTSATAYSNTATTNTAVNFNGNDAVALYKISTASYVDIFGVIGNDPSTAWTSGSYSTLDRTLVRKSTIYSGVTTNPTSFSTLSTEWDLYITDNVSNLGSHTFYAPSYVNGYEAKIISGQATTNDVVNGLTSGTSYYYRVRSNSGSSTSGNSSTITVTTATPPTTPTGTGAARCDDGTVTISATPGAGATIDWYSASTGGTLLASSSTSYVTPIISSTTVYYAEARNTTGGCTSVSRQAVTATVNITPSAPTANASQTFCTGATISNLSATGSPIQWYAAATSGSPLSVGSSLVNNTHYYVSRTINGCESSRTDVTVTVNANNTASVASSTPTLCINTALTAITHTTTGATGIGSPTGLPIGVSASWASNTITISGTPTQSGTFNYSIPLTGGCGSVNATGTIIVNANNTLGIASSTQTVLANTTLTNITHTTTGATGISGAGQSGANTLPAGVSAAWASNTITISGTPTSVGTFAYSIPLTGGCGSVNATGTITVDDAYTWTGAVSSAWSEANNWSPNGVPTSADNVNITSVSSPYYQLEELSALTINQYSTFTLKANAKLSLSGIITNNGNFTIENGATLVQTGTGTNSGGGAYNVKQNITGAGSGTPTGRYWYVGSPVSGATSAVYDAAGANILKYYSEPANAWQEITVNNAALEVGRGYFVQAASGTSELNFTGGTINNGSYTLNVTRNTSTNAYRGYNLLTNPYPSYLNWDNVTRNQVGTTIWYRSVNNAGTMVFDTYNAPGGTGTNNNQAGAVTRYIPPMQSFWVSVPQGQTSGTVSFGNAQRSHFIDLATNGYNGLRSSAQDFPAFLRLNLLDGNFVDQTILYMKPDANNTFDEYDSEKMFLGGVPQFYSTVNAKKLVLNGMKNQKARTSVPLTMELPTSKSYTFQAEEFNIEDGLILLEDKQEGIIQDLTINPTYSFFGNAGTNATRFVVHFQLANAPVLVGGPQELENLGMDQLSTDNIQITSNNQGTVIIRLDEGFKPEGSIRIFDARGRLVEQTDFNDQETTIQLKEQAGMYFVEVAAGKLMVKKKIVIE